MDKKVYALKIGDPDYSAPVPRTVMVTESEEVAKQWVESAPGYRYADEMKPYPMVNTFAEAEAYWVGSRRR